MTIAWMPSAPGWDGPDDSVRWSDLTLAEFLTDVAERGPSSPSEVAYLDLIRSTPVAVPPLPSDAVPVAELERAHTIERRIRSARIAEFTAKQIRVAERLLGITEEDR